MKREPLSQSTLPAITLEKAPTFIAGLDDILEGGLPRNRTTVFNGGAGSGKTLLGLEILYRGALAGEPGIFLTFEESPEQLRQNAASLSWDLLALEQKSQLFLLDGRIKSDTLLSGSFSLKGLLAIAAGKSREMRARRIVIDGLEVVLRLFDDPRQVRNEIHMLNDWLHASGLTVILTVRPPSPAGIPFYEEFFESMSDCIIRLDARVIDQITTRRLRVIKYRGSSFGRNEYPYSITATGLHTAPITSVGLQHKPLGEKIPTGIPQLDDILDGGYRRGACILIAGLPGTGKTILAATFANAACSRGENVLYISFEESEAVLVKNVASAGVTLQSHLDTGRLSFLTNYPEAMGAEEHYFQARSRINKLSPGSVVVDAISACERMGGKQAAYEYLMRLLNFCKEMGITVLMVNQLTGRASFMEISGNSISSMVDTVIFLNYEECPGETNRTLQVLKARGSKHSNQKREFIITDNGVHILDVYIGTGEMLTGTLRQRQEEKNRHEVQQLTFDIEAKELELKRLRFKQEQMAKSSEHRAEMTDKNPLSSQRQPAPDEAESAENLREEE